jgi:hypothetical protein
VLIDSIVVGYVKCSMAQFTTVDCMYSCQMVLHINHGMSYDNL